MSATPRTRRRLDGPVAALLMAAALALLMPVAADAASRYVVEFRARDGGVFGHTYVAYGPVDRDGRLRHPHYVGFYPSGILSQTALLAVLVTPVRSLTAPKPDIFSTAAVTDRRARATAPCDLHPPFGGT